MGSGKDRPQYRQAFCSLKKVSSPLSASTTAMAPAPSRRAVSTELVSRVSMPGFTVIRSTTTMMSCLRFSCSLMFSSRERTSPSILTRTKPLFLRSERSSAYAPFRPRTIGAAIRSLRPSGISDIRSTIC